MLLNRYIFFVIFIILFGGSNVAFAVENKKPKIAVLNFSSEKSLGSFSRISRYSVESAFVNNSSFETLEYAQIDEISKMITKNNKNKTNDQDIGQALDADIVVTGSVKKINNSYQISFKIISIREHRPIAIKSYDFKNISQLRSVSKQFSILGVDTIKDFYKKRFPISFDMNIHYVLPHGYLSTLVDFGYSASLSCAVYDLFDNNFFPILDARYIRYRVKSDKIYSAYMLPITIGAGYELKYSSFSFMPIISVGASYSKIVYYLNQDHSEYSSRSNTDLILKFSMLLKYKLKKEIYTHIGTDYISYIESKDRTQLYSIFGGIGFYF